LKQEEFWIQRKLKLNAPYSKTYFNNVQTNHINKAFQNCEIKALNKEQYIEKISANF
jgi:hypothetical protein